MPWATPPKIPKAMVTPTLLFTMLLLATLALTSAYLRGTKSRPAT